MSKIKRYAIGLVYILVAGIAGSAIIVLGFIAVTGILSFMFWSLPLHSPVPTMWILSRLGFVLGIGFGACTVSDFLRGYSRSTAK